MTETTRPPATVLVVDDEKNIRRTLRLVLEGEGFTTIEAERAETA
ncbi:response regulator, partial [bacterium]